MYDFGIIRQGEKVAVLCRTEKEALDFHNALRNHNPEACRHWHQGETNWFYYRENTCYTVHDDYTHIESLTYAEVSFFIENGYRIVTPADLIANDFGEFDIMEGTVCGFFGIGGV